MKINVIGLGQCGSFVVYDLIAVLFNLKTSIQIRAVSQSHWKHDLNKMLSRFYSRGGELKMGYKKYFTDLHSADMPYFFVMDGNRKNAIVDGLQGLDINKRPVSLPALVKPLIVSNRNNGCTLGQIGEYVFRNETIPTANSKVFKKINSKPVEINALVFAGGGGSGSGGAPVLNEELYNKNSLLFNMMVLPPYRISDQRQAWNTGRCIMRLASTGKQTALILFSNLSEDLSDQYNVNLYIGKLILRLANFGYPGNLTKGATDIDRKDLQTFFAGKPAFIGMSSLKKNDPGKEDIEELVERALTHKREQGVEGLSTELPRTLEQAQLHQIKKVMIALGLPPEYAGNARIVDTVKDKVAKLLGIDLRKLDCRAYSYTSPEEIELTIFLLHSNYKSNFLLYHFLNAYLKWHNSEKTEYDYLTKKVTDPTGRDFLEEVNKTMAAEADNNSSVWLKDNFSKYKIYKIEEFEKIEDIEKTEEIQ